MKKKSTSIFWGIIFILSGFIGIIQVNILSGIICFIIAFLLLFPFKAKEESSSPIGKPENNTEPDKSFTFPIVGVTFKNDDGTDRQKLLRKIYFKDPPFDTEQNVSLERYLWKGDPAYSVKVNDYMVGNISSDLVWYFEKNSNRPYNIEYITVYGGGGDKNYGAEIHGVYLDV